MAIILPTEVQYMPPLVSRLELPSQWSKLCQHHLMSRHPEDQLLPWLKLYRSRPNSNLQLDDLALWDLLLARMIMSRPTWQ